MTIARALSGRDNALNLVRLVMAGAVIVSHTWPLGGFGEDPAFGGMTLGRWAVAVFFAVSGYLVTGSRLRLPFEEFMRRRLHRILPGLWASLLVTACAIAPIACAISGETFSPAAAAVYVVSNAASPYFQFGIAGTLQSTPVSAWNGSLGTLQHEMTMYLLMGAMLGLTFVRRWPRPAAVFLVGAFTGGQAFAAFHGHTGGLLGDFLHFGAFFAAGLLLRVLGDWVRADRRVATLCFLALLGLGSVEMAGLFGALPLAYLALWVGVVLPMRWGAVNDYSYGAYVFAFPVQQLLTVAGVPRFGLLVYLLSGAAVTAPLAVASWWLVERPVLRLRSTARSGGVATARPRSSTAGSQRPPAASS